MEYGTLQKATCRGIVLGTALSARSTVFCRAPSARNSVFLYITKWYHLFFNDSASYIKLNIKYVKCILKNLGNY
jgi:hypothetical protein